MVLDLDASLVEIHSENKEGTAANYKHGFGFSPMFCFADATGIAKTDLPFRRVDIHVHGRGIDLDKKECDRILSLHQRGVVAFLQRAAY